ncbi:AAA family ATPase [Sneathiella sp. P13V-1]|nr:AAA family ATPase [Sneathiella sp. P13V-1]
MLRGGKNQLDEAAVRQLAANSIARLFDNLYEGAVVVDTSAKIVWMNDKYKALIGWNGVEKMRGIPVEDVIPQSRMREVVETGKAELLDIFSISGRDTVVSRIPLEDESGDIVGALGVILYDRLNALKPLVSRFQTMQSDLKKSRKELAETRRARYSFREFVGHTPSIRALKNEARRAAKGTATILLRGETGTGKEVLAHAIHASSDRAHMPMIRLNTAAIPEHLLEAELFGTEPGAFTGASDKTRRGKFQAADGGTLFLDEVGDMPLPLQAKLLRVLQEKEVEPLGANKVVPVDVRIIAATSRNLEKMIEDGEFRPDLFYRLNVVQLNIPPLRNRKEDIALLCEFLMEIHAGELDRGAIDLAPECLELFHAHNWPGNVRELSGLLQRAMVTCTGDQLTSQDFKEVLKLNPKTITPSTEPSPSLLDTEGEIMDLKTLQQQTEKRAIIKALKITGGNRSKAAKLLGISRAQFYEKLGNIDELSGIPDNK